MKHHAGTHVAPTPPHGEQEHVLVKATEAVTQAVVRKEAEVVAAHTETPAKTTKSVEELLSEKVCVGSHVFGACIPVRVGGLN